MATIKSQMVLEDGVSGILKKMTRAMDITLASFEQMQAACGEAVDTSLIEEGRGLLVEVNHEFEQMAEECQKAAQEEEKLNQDIKQGTSAMDSLLCKAASMAATYASLSKVKDFSVGAMEAADVQIGAQVQLKTVMSNIDDPFADAMSHYNPGRCEHPYHAGDLPPLFGNNGFALCAFLTDRFSIDEV